MPDPDRLLATLRRAAEAFRTTPGRRGRLVSVADAADVLVSGDLHGNVENFRGLLKIAELAKHPRRHLVLQELVHGPFLYPAGGDKSHQLLDLLAALKCQYPDRVHFLLGNHELAQWAGRPIFKDDEDMNEGFRRGIRTAYGDRAEEVYAVYLELFAAANLAVRTPNRVFLCHSLPSAARMDRFELSLLERDDADDQHWRHGGGLYALLWGRDNSAANVAAFLQKVDADLLITGHIACDGGYATPNDRQLVLDSLDTPAGYCLFPADRPLTHAELVACVGTL